MRYLLLLMWLFSENSLIGQNFNLSELIKMKKMNADEFDTYVVKKGYEFFQNNQGDDFTYSSTTYTYKVNGAKQAYITKYSNELKKIMISFQTINSKVYLNFKNDLKIQGFTLLDSGPNDETNVLRYRKGNIEVLLITGPIRDEANFNNITGYEISVKDFK